MKLVTVVIVKGGHWPALMAYAFSGSLPLYTVTYCIIVVMCGCDVILYAYFYYYYYIDLL